MVDNKYSVNNPDGEILKELRERLGKWTQEDLANALGVTRQTIGNTERGAHELKLSLKQICKLFELLDKAQMSVYDLARKSGVNFK